MRHLFIVITCFALITGCTAKSDIQPGEKGASLFPLPSKEFLKLPAINDPKGRKQASYFENADTTYVATPYQNVVFNPGLSYSGGDDALDFYPKDGSNTGIAYRVFKWYVGSTDTGTISLEWLKSPALPATYRIGLLNFPHWQFDWTINPLGDEINLQNADDYISNGYIVICVCVETTEASVNQPDASLSEISVFSVTKLAVADVGYLPESAGVYQPRIEMPASMAPVLLPPVVDLSSRLPPCGNQGNAGNCVTWAIVSGCLNLELDAVYGPLGRTPTDESFIPSVRYAYVGARYLYNNQNAPESDPGADALRFLYEYGTPSELDAPTGVGGGHVWGPGDPAWWSSPLLDLSLNRKANLIDLEDHWSIHDGRTPAEGPALLNCIKTIVGRDRRGVAVGFFLNQHNPNQHNSPENPWIYDFTPVDPHDQLSFAGNHEMCVVGYDDNLQVLKLRNSRGPLWGDYDGYVFLSYQNFLNTSMPALPVMNAITIAEDYHSSTAQTYLGLGATEAYPPPNHFRATPGSYPDKVILRWDSLPGAVRYSVYRDNLPNEYMHYTVEDPDAPICIVYDEASSPGTTHTYWVRASFSDGQVGAISRPIYGWASAAGGGI